MAHPYDQYKEVHAGRRVAKERSKHFKRGGAVHSDVAEDKKLIKQELKKHEAEEMKSEGKKGKARLDKRARGGGVKHGGKKGHKTHINIVVAPKGGDAAVPPPGAGAGGPPPGGPMIPPGPMAPPPGPLGAGPPGMGGPPGMKRGGGVPRGISSKANLEHWSNRAKSNTKYERGGKVKMHGGADSGIGRLDKIKAYGKRARGN